MNFRKLALAALLFAIGASQMQAEEVSKIAVAKEAVSAFLTNAKENSLAYFEVGKDSIQNQIKKIIGVNDASYLAFNTVAAFGACYGLKKAFEGLFPAANERQSTSKFFGGAALASLFLGAIIKSKDILKACQ